jgi:hypothetical protein
MPARRNLHQPGQVLVGVTMSGSDSSPPTAEATGKLLAEFRTAEAGQWLPRSK